MLSLVLLLCAGSTFLLSEAGLTTSGSNLFYNGQKVFLSGVNIAWNSYGYDFGNGAYEANSKATLERWLTQIANAGGNSVRKCGAFKFQIKKITRNKKVNNT